MYFVDREKIEKTLQFLQENIEIIESQKAWTTVIEKKAIERIGQTIIESILDVGNSMIDGFIMRDPGSFEDIIDILEDEKVVTVNDAVSLRKVIKLRKNVVLEYLSVEHDLLIETLMNELETIKAYAPAINQYLANELGPVSAFRN
jgi:uncharacterized protein YutE (UPF0331/DUF86 family)